MVNISRILNVSNVLRHVTEVTIPLKPGLSKSGNVINFVEKASRNKIPVNFSENALLHSYPGKVQDKLRNVCQNFMDNDKSGELSFLKNLVEVNPNYEYISKLVNNTEDFNKYALAKNKLNKNFVPKLKGKIPEKIRQNLAMMRVYNPENYKAFIKSKGYKDIIDKKLDLVYLKDITPDSKVDDKFFYDLFYNLEQKTNLRLKNIKNLDASLAQKYIKNFDENISKDSMFLDKLLKDLEATKNVEVTNKILKEFEDCMTPSSVSQIRSVINLSEENPKLVNKIFDMKDVYPSDAEYILNLLKGKENQISEEMLDYIIKYQQKNPNVFAAYKIGGVNKFLQATNKDENLLKSVLKLAEEKQDRNLINIIYSITPNNIGYLKESIKLGKLDEEFITKLQIMGTSEIFKDPKNWAIADDIYKETYLPFKKVLSNSSTPFYKDYIASSLAEIRAANPEQYKKLEDLGVLKFIKDKKIDPRIVLGLHGNKDFVPEVYEDLKMLQSGKSIIKKFDNFDKILTKTKAGDVVSVRGKLYINNDGKLERWNMTEEKFNDLFPLVDRFTTKQGSDDCYLISAMDSLYKNPKSRGSYYKMFEQKGNDIYVTIPAYKDFKGTIKFPDGKINITSLNADGAKHIQMVEQAYARTALRRQKRVPTGQDPLTTDDLFYLVNRNRTGNVSDVMEEVLLFNNNIQKYNPKRKINTYIARNKVSSDVVNNFFENNNTAQNVICNIGLLLDPGSGLGHAMQLKSYNPVTKTFQIVDPTFCGLQETYSLDEISSKLYEIAMTHLK